MFTLNFFITLQLVKRKEVMRLKKGNFLALILHEQFASFNFTIAFYSFRISLIIKACT